MTDLSIRRLIDALQRSHDEHGTSVRCPTCNAGAGRWCVLPDGTRPSRQLITHPERIALAEKEANR